MDQSSRKLSPPSLRAYTNTSSRRRRLVLSAALGIALALAFLVDGLAVEMVGPLRTSALAELLRNSVRWLGTGYVQIGALLLMSAGGRLFRSHWPPGEAWALVALAASGVGATILKVLIHRPRPWSENSLVGVADHPHTSECYSFPSGESSTTFAVAVVLASWYPTLRVPLFAVAVAVGVARVLVGSHYPSDVLGGALVGVAAAQIVTRLGGSMGQRRSGGEAARKSST